jgi:hypothetical protein
LISFVVPARLPARQVREVDVARKPSVIDCSYSLRHPNDTSKQWIRCAGIAGGIEVTTFALLAFIMLAEVRGEPTVHVLGRRLPAAVQRQALTVALAGVGLVMVSTVTLLSISDFGLEVVLFETVAAFSTA